MEPRPRRRRHAFAVFVVALGLLGAGGSAAFAQKQDDASRELAALRPKIHEAIDRGAAFLLARQERDGSFEGDDHRYPLGQTALTIYTLLKSGVPLEHPVVRRGLAYLRPRMPEETYSAACVLMALEATHDPAWLPKIQAVADRLLRWQVRGIFSYPKAHTDVVWPDEPGVPDLSNTQFAALGLRAAARAGVKIRPETWIALAEATFPWQEEKGRLVETEEGGYRRQVVAAGFRYRIEKNAAGKHTREPTGSMTCAGIGVLQIVREQLGAKASSGFAEKIRVATERGIAWLVAHWDVTKNPGVGDEWWVYYLYGLERTGALLGVEDFGPYRWYLEGARELLRRQGGSGDWPASGRVHADTCFALLFLKRATAGTTGGAGPRRPEVASEAADADVRFRVAGGTDGSPLSMFVTGFGDAAVGAHAGGPNAPVPGLRILAVEWLVDERPVAKIAGDPRRGRVHESYAATYVPTRRGKHVVRPRAVVVWADAAPDAVTPTAELEGRPVELTLEHVFEPWMEEAAGASLRNLCAPGDVKAEASSAQSEGRSPARAFDGRQTTGWYFASTDERPTITATFERAPRADTLVLSPANGMLARRDGHDVATKVRVTVNSAPPFEVAMEADELVPTRVPLGAPAAIRKLKIEVLERRKGRSWPGFGGFAEIALELAPKK